MYIPFSDFLSLTFFLILDSPLYFPDFRQSRNFEFYDYRHLEHLPDLLHSADVELRIEAGETIALLYELARQRRK